MYPYRECQKLPRGTVQGQQVMCRGGMRNFWYLVQEECIQQDTLKGQSMMKNSTAILPAQFIHALNDLGFNIEGQDLVCLEPLSTIVKDWNQQLGFPPGHPAEFKYAEPLPPSPTSVPISPIPFTVTGWPIKVVFWGLNPHCDLETVEAEKSAAQAYDSNVSPGTWEAYAHFYLNYPFSNSEPWPGSLKWAITSRYYYNLGTVTGTLKDKKFTLLRERYDKALPAPERRLNAFWDIA